MTNDRRTRRRASALAATVATLAGGGIAALTATAAGATAPAAAQSPHIVRTAAPGAASPATPSATGAATRAASAAGTKTGTAARTSAAEAAAASPAGRGQVAASQLPAAAVEKWKPTGAPSTRGVAGHDIGENECAKVDGASAWTQQAFSGGDGQNVAIQDTFAFGSASAAQAAYQNVVAGMNGCQQTTRALQAANKTPQDAKVVRTAGDPQAEAWARDWTGVMGMSADGPQDNHFYLAVNGTRLIVLQFTEFPGQAAAYDVAADPRVLAMLEAEPAA